VENQMERIVQSLEEEEERGNVISVNTLFYATI
jgi:hypothetical protein